VKHERTYTLSEVVDLGFEACHVTEDGVWWLFHGCWALRRDPRQDTRTLVMDAVAMPVGPWRLTEWGEAELRRSQADERG
jgi:hypothetical protein